MKRVYLIGYYGYQNAGDDAMLMGICDELNKREVPFKFYFKGQELREVISNILKADIVAIGGGTHFRNWGEGWLLQGLRILGVGLAVRLLGKQFHMWNVGIDGKRWEWLVRHLCNYLSIRDRNTFDSAVLMSQPIDKIAKKSILGINVTPVNTIYHNNYLADYLSWIQLFETLKMWKKDYPDWKIRFISLNSHSKYSDNVILNNGFSELLSKYSPMLGEVEFIPYGDNPIEPLEKIGECSKFIGMRYHSCVFAYMTDTPLWKLECCKSYPSVEEFRDILPKSKARELASIGIRTE